MLSNPKNQSGTEERHKQRTRLVGTGTTSCSGGTAAATGSGELSGLGILDARIGTERQANECSYKNLQVNSFPTVAACACSERPRMGVE